MYNVILYIYICIYIYIYIHIYTYIYIYICIYYKESLFQINEFQIYIYLRIIYLLSSKVNSFKNHISNIFKKLSDSNRT